MTIKVGIVYFSNTDITGQLARSAAHGVETAGGEVYSYKIEGSEIRNGRFNHKHVFYELEGCDAIIFASPTYMGGPAAQFKAFADATSFVYSHQDWRGKVAAGITSGSGLNGDQTSTLQYFSILASQHGMCWLGISPDLDGSQSTKINRLGCQLGVVAQSESDEADEVDLRTAFSLGDRITRHLV